MQTPQVFRRQLLLDAFAARGGNSATDEAEMVERLGHPIQIVEGSPMNLKITTPDDLRMAAALLGTLTKQRLPDSLLAEVSELPPPEKPGLW